VRFDDLREGQRVSFTIGQGPKGPRAEGVKVE
jgi:CspA family cold shock protein